MAAMMMRTYVYSRAIAPIRTSLCMGTLPPTTLLTPTLLRACTSSAHLDSRHSRKLVTTPIFYVNGRPHIGHAYTAVLADAISRYLRLRGDDVLFATGTDEHGQKVAASAEKMQMSPIEFATINSNAFRSLFEKLNVEYDDFIRTTEERHKNVVQKVWKILIEKGAIYKGVHEGWYCESDEVFVPDTQVVEREVEERDGDKIVKTTRTVAILDGVEKEVKHVREENYMFRMEQYKERLEAWLRSSAAVTPVGRLNEALANLQNLKDLSVSRPARRVPFAILVPNDDSQAIYVWLDALFNYMTVSKHAPRSQQWWTDTDEEEEELDAEFQRQSERASSANTVVHWPPSIQVLGKDILKFHALFWPAFLMALDEKLPETLLVHSHWLSKGMKMSKSIGNVIDPDEMIEKLGVDGLRYAMLREGAVTTDGNFDAVHLAEKANSELADTFGNLISRITGKRLAPEGSLWRPCPDALSGVAGADSLIERAVSLPNTLSPILEGHTSNALDSICNLGWDANAFVEKNAPWAIRKEEKAAMKAEDTQVANKLREKRNAVLHTAAVCGASMAACLAPFVPGVAGRAASSLSLDLPTIFQSPSSLKSMEFVLSQNKGGVVFEKIETERLKM